MSMNVVVFGAGDIAELAHFYLTRDSPWRPVAFTVDAAYVRETSFCGAPVVAFEEIQQRFDPADHHMFVAISYSQVNALRAAKYYEAKRKGYKLISYVSSRATYYGQEIGDNCFIFEDNTIQPFTKIGSNVTMWSGNHIGHHSTIGDHCFISSHVVVSGGVIIEPYCFLGVNSTLRDHVRLGEKTVVAMGALVTRDCEANSVYVGSPAQRKSSSSSEELKRI
jgi:sugar O-acyltransferase (sialic acid O-acetyltransferase NeuD family)